ncbi:putative holin, partial [Pseudomonas aeruginosa]|uniref:putative holin n=1 Tax=Pseudomonas aeruginosa TaxID=287 RepID=UPI003CC5E1BD
MHFRESYKSEPSSAASPAPAKAGRGLAKFQPGFAGNPLLGGFGGALLFFELARDINPHS